MALTMAQFISAAEAGNAIKIRQVQTDAVNPVGVAITIGNTLVNVKKAYYDIGDYHTAKQVLDSYSLREALNESFIEADTGTTSLSREPVI